MTDLNPRIAVIGAGLIGRKHLDVVSSAATLGAVVDPAPEAEALARAHGAAFYGDLDTCLAHETLHGVIIATPNQLHLAHARAAIAAGLPMLIEKPLAENSENAAAIVDEAAAAGVPVLVGHHRRHSTIAKGAHDAIKSGRLGRLVTVDAQFWLFKPDDYFDAAWRRQPGAGPLFINLIHDIDLLRHFCGEIARVHAVKSNAVRGFEVEDSAAVILEFANGALGTVTISDTVAAPWSWELTAGENPAYPRTDRSCYRIGGTDGALSVPDLRLWHHPERKSWWEPIEAEMLTAAPTDPVAAQFNHFCDVINGAAPIVSAHEGLQNLRVLDAISRSARTGRGENVV